jgi:hypothetical protein
MFSSSHMKTSLLSSGVIVCLDDNIDITIWLDDNICYFIVLRDNIEIIKCIIIWPTDKTMTLLSIIHQTSKMMKCNIICIDDNWCYHLATVEEKTDALIIVMILLD